MQPLPIFVSLPFSCILRFTRFWAAVRRDRTRKSSRCKDKDRDRLIERRHHLHTEKMVPAPISSRTDTDTGKTDGKSKSHTDAVKERRDDRIERSISFRSSKDDTVYYDQRDINTKTLIQRRYIRLKQNCTIVTKDATTTIKAGIRTPFGMTLRSAEIIKFDMARDHRCRKSHAKSVHRSRWLLPASDTYQASTQRSGFL